MNKKVSIIVPIYNKGNKLNKCLDSLINQTYKNFEVILINDGSNDNSGEICDYYKNIDNRFVVVHKINEGVSLARNIGIDLSNGDYLIFVDGDDIVKPNMLEEMVDNLEKSQAEVLISGITFIQNNQILLEKVPETCGIIGDEIWEYISNIESDLYGYVSNKLYRVDVIRDNNIYFDEYRKIQEDLDFAIRVFSKCNKFYLLQESYYFYEYEPKGRIPDHLGYMEIEIKKREIYKQKGLYEKCKYSHCNKLSNMIFSYLYWLPKNKEVFFKKVNKLYNLDNINESLSVKEIKSVEQKYIGILLKNKLVNHVRIYFIIRKFLVNSIKFLILIGRKISL